MTLRCCWENRTGFCRSTSDCNNAFVGTIWIVKPLHLFLLIVMSGFWAASYSAFKALSPWLDPGGITTLRFGITSIVLLLAWPWLPGLAPRKWDLMQAMLMGIIVFAVAPRLQIGGVQKGHATHGSVLVALEPLVASIAAAIFLRERIGSRQALGFVFGIFGVILMADLWHPNFRPTLLVADGLILLSFICEAAYSVMGKPLLRTADPLKILTIACWAATGVNLLLDGETAARAVVILPLRAWLLLLYLSLVCTVLGYSLWLVVIREAQVSAAALTVFVQPVFGIVIAILWLGETVRAAEIAGSLVIMSGVILGLSPIRPLRLVES